MAATANSLDDDRNYLLDVVNNVLNTIDRFTESGDPSVDFQPLMFKMDYLQRLMVNLDVDESTVDMVGQAYSMLQVVSNRGNGNSDAESPGTAALVRSGARGRPSFDIKEEQLQYLVEQGFKVSDISKIVGTSTRTVERRMASFGLSISGNGNVHVPKHYNCRSMNYSNQTTY